MPEFHNRAKPVKNGKKLDTLLLLGPNIPALQTGPWLITANPFVQQVHLYNYNFIIIINILLLRSDFTCKIVVSILVK